MTLSDGAENEPSSPLPGLRSINTFPVLASSARPVASQKMPIDVLIQTGLETPKQLLEPSLVALLWGTPSS